MKLEWTRLDDGLIGKIDDLEVTVFEGPSSLHITCSIPNAIGLSDGNRPFVQRYIDQACKQLIHLKRSSDTPNDQT